MRHALGIALRHWSQTDADHVQVIWSLFAVTTGLDLLMDWRTASLIREQQRG